jgi:hypothetical protein
VFDPKVMWCVPVTEACSAMTREDARDVGGFGGGAIAEARFEDDIVPLLERGIVPECLLGINDDVRR